MLIVAVDAAVSAEPRLTAQETTIAESEAEPGQINSPTVKLLDPDGNPLEGAWVGVGAHGESEKSLVWSPYSPHGVSNADGRAELVGRGLPAGRVVLYARHVQRKLAGLQEFKPEELLAGAKMMLHPACHVRGTLKSSMLAAASRKLEWTNVYLYAGDVRPLSFDSKEHRFEFFLPPGKYRLDAYGTDTLDVARDIEVGANQRELSVETIDLPATKLAMLIGKPAPELREIKEWNCNPPLNLKELRGNFVLLTFWGYWCGPCVREVPHLMKLHDAFADRGLVVLSVHDASIGSIAEMNQKLTTAREREWWGRDIPFPIALDSGGETAPDATRQAGHGATTEAYGITSFPTTLLIDREGKIVKTAAAWDADLPAKLDSLLGTEGRPPAWRTQLDEVYQLAPGQIVRRIAPPFIPERTPYITAAYNAIGGVGTRPDRLTLVWDGKLQRKNAGSAKLIDVLQSFADWQERDDSIDCPAELARRIIPGDWIVAADAPLADRFSAVETVLRQELRQRIRLVKGQVERDVIVVSGEYQFHPLRTGDKHIHLSTNDRDLDDVMGGGSGPMKDLLASLTVILGSRFIDETSGAEKLPLIWSQHPSAVLARPAPPEDVEKILAKMTKQTSLKFERQRRSVGMWLVREAP